MDLKNLKQLKNWIPETYLVLSVLFYWMSSSLLNPIAIALLLVMIIVLWRKNRALGITISAVFLLLNLYMVLALVSDLVKFTTFNKSFWSELIVGGMYIGLNVFLSARMLEKWVMKPSSSHRFVQR